jgi:sugar O-acyltransferase (sialic acid O-acetyltransferase NeuD family)
MKSILVYGTGGMGREAAQVVRDLAKVKPDEIELVGFIDDAAAAGAMVHDVPVYTLTDAVRLLPGAGVLVAVGSPVTRRRLVSKSTRLRFRAATLIHPSSLIGHNVRIGSGAFVAPGVVLTCDLTLGEHVQVNVGTVVHHDCVVGDYVTLSPRVTLCGAVVVERDAFIGAGATVRQGLTIGQGAVVGLGAVVLGDVAPGETWVGNPARRRRSDAD